MLTANAEKTAVTTTASGWYNDPSNPAQVRYWDGARWTEQVAVLPPVAPAPGAPADQTGPSSAAYWLVPVGRSWQSVIAGYLGLLCLVAWFGGPFGMVVGGVTVWLGIWGMKLARTGGHGRGRAIFGIIAGSLSVLGGAVGTYVWFS